MLLSRSSLAAKAVLRAPAAAALRRHNSSLNKPAYRLVLVR